MRWWNYFQTLTFLKSQNWAYPWINSLKFSTVYFHYTPSWRLPKCMKLSCRLSNFTSYKVFLKKTKCTGVSLSATCHWRAGFEFSHIILCWLIGTSFTEWLIHHSSDQLQAGFYILFFFFICVSIISKIKIL